MKLKSAKHVPPLAVEVAGSEIRSPCYGNQSLRSQNICRKALYQIYKGFSLKKTGNWEELVTNSGAINLQKQRVKPLVLVTFARM